MNRPRMKTKFSTYLLLSIFLLAFLPNLATATIIATGTSPAYPLSAPFGWDIEDVVHVGDPDPNFLNLIIGDTTTGSMIINGGSWVQDANGYIGKASGGTGTVEVTGQWSMWYNQGRTSLPVQPGTGYLYVGYNGTGVMNILDGGYVYNAADGYIGFGPGSKGTVTVSGGQAVFDEFYEEWYWSPSMWSITDDLIVGSEGTGTLLIEKGGYVGVGGYTSVYIGDMPGSTGTVTVTGKKVYKETDTPTVPETDGLFTGAYQDRSLLISNGPIYVGNEGKGTLSILDGGYVESAGGYIGKKMSDSPSTVTVSGPGSYQESTNLDDLDFEWIEGSQWINNGPLVVGDEGNGVMDVKVGGKVTSWSGLIGNESGSSGTVTVTGPQVYKRLTNEDDETWLELIEGSRWENYGQLVVGDEGNGKLSILDGGYVESAGGYIGMGSDSISTVTVKGRMVVQESTDEDDTWHESINQSGWINYGNLVVGGEGIGTLSIEDGGYVSSSGASIGNQSDSSGTVTVTGGEILQESTDEDNPWNELIDGSRWINTGQLVVGGEGVGTLLIEKGGYVSSVGGSIGSMSGSTGTVTVTGPNSVQESAAVGDDLEWTINGSRWENSGELVVGGEGVGTLMISDGGFVKNTNAYIAKDMISTGTVTVTGENSEWKNDGSLYVGGSSVSHEEIDIPYGGEATLFIEKGGSVSSNYGYIGTGELARGEVTVTGEDSEWENSGDLVIGRYEGYGVMDVNDGGRVRSSNNLIIGGQDGGYGTMDVNDGKVNSKMLTVGKDGGEGEMFISNHGDVTNKLLYVGNNGYGTLSISNGGTMESDMAYIGNSSDEDEDEDEDRARGSVTVTGKDSAWDINGGLYVGRDVRDLDEELNSDGGDGELLISDGGKVTSKEGHIGTDFFSSGLVTVTGQNSVWDNTYEIQVGGERDYSEDDYDDFQGDHEDYYAAGPGELNISEGGVVKAGSVVIGPGGILSGNGTLESKSVSNEGTIKPGNSIGTLTINGNLEIQPDSIYEVEIDNSGNSDLLKVNGDVDIVGGIVQTVSTETITGAQHYMIIEANNVSGTFDTLDTALLDLTMSYSDIGLGYEPNSVMLNIDAKRFDDPSIAQNDNQSSLGGALQQIADGDGNPITTALQGLKTNGEVSDALNQLNPPTRPQSTYVSGIVTDKSLGTVSNKLNYADQGISYYDSSSSSMFANAGPDPTDDNRSTYDTRPNFSIGNNEASFGDPKLSFWGKGYGVFGQRDNGGGIAGYDYNIYGSIFGVDYQVSDSSLLGITAGYSTSSIDSYLPGGESDISGTHIGIYGTKNMDEWHVDSILTGSFLKFDTERYVNFNTIDEQLKGDFDGMGISGYVEARYDLQTQSSDSWLIQPLAAFQFSCLRLSEYTETGGESGNTSAIAYEDENYNSYKGSLGIKLTQQLFERENKRNASVQLRGRWIHEFGDDNSSVDAHFASDPDAVFEVSSENVSRDSAVLGASFNAGLSRHTQISLGYDTQLNSDDTMHVFSAMLAYRW